jgi:hypothetical protein
MIIEYVEYLNKASHFSKAFGETFKGIQFEEKSQTVETFVLQALAMCSSHCRSAALLLQNDFVGESATVLRSIQELLFDLYWIKEAENKEDRCERAYQLEADPYSHWDKETNIICKESSFSIGPQLRNNLKNVAVDYPFLTESTTDGTVSFKSAPSFASRMGNVLRAKYYHIYCYSSIFTHPTPLVKSLYLKSVGSTSSRLFPFEESHKELIAYTLFFIKCIFIIADDILGSFASSSQPQRYDLYNKMDELVDISNNGYFHQNET